MSDLKAVLQSLQSELAKELLRKLRSGEATAADMNVMRAFLKDNNIESLPVEGSALRDLAASLPFAGSDHAH